MDANQGLAHSAPQKTTSGAIVGILMLLFPTAAFVQVPGSLDASFGDAGKVLTDITGSNDEAASAALQPDGKIVVAGSTSDPVDGRVAMTLVRYLPDGAIDDSFGDSGVARASFGGAGSTGQSVVIQADGRIVVGGDFFGEQGLGFAIARFLPTGELDITFGENGRVTTMTDRSLSVLLLQPDAKILAVGGAVAIRYLPDGSLDTTWGIEGTVIGPIEQAAAALQSDGKIVTAGWLQNPEDSEFAVARYLPDGSLDATFGGGDGFVTTAAPAAQFRAVTIQADGRIVAAGRQFNSTALHVDFALVRYLPDGTLDTGFGEEGVASSDFGAASEVYALRTQEDGRLVAAGLVARMFGLARYLPDGTLDPTFGSAGLVTTSFGTGDSANSAIRALLVQPDARLVAVGYATLTGEGGLDFALARYESGIVVPHGPPTSQEQCKHGGWRSFNVPRTFKNQGDCISFVNTGH